MDRTLPAAVEIRERSYESTEVAHACLTLTHRIVALDKSTGGRKC